MDQLPLNPLLRGMYEAELELQEAEKRTKNATLDEANHFKEMDEKAKFWRNHAKEHYDHADDHRKKAHHKHSGESRRTHESRIAAAHDKVAHAFQELADAYHGKEHRHHHSLDMPATANPSAY